MIMFSKLNFNDNIFLGIDKYASIKIKFLRVIELN